jgi:Lon protease-like protein
MSQSEIPLFPLNTVLFPGGPLSLRIFEPRYLDMIGDCMKRGSGFGVVLIQEGSEAGEAPEFHEIGTLAEIIDFDRLEDGLLGIACRGGPCFRVLSHRVEPDQLVVARVESLPDERRMPVPVDQLELSNFLRGILDRDEVRSYRKLLAEDWDSAAWVGSRLTELLPLPMPAKQTLLELARPVERLEVLHAILRDQQLI